jgi:large subunit ribosomal protein L19e
MTVKITRRIAAILMKRGESSIRITAEGTKDASQVITRDDVRRLIKEGKVFALKKKENMSLYSKILKKKRMQGRKRGPGKKKGGKKVRKSIEYSKKVRGQRRVLFQLKADNTITNEQFKSLYKLVRGGIFTSKASLLTNIAGRGIVIKEDRYKQLKHA